MRNFFRKVFSRNPDLSHSAKCTKLHTILNFKPSHFKIPGKKHKNTSKTKFNKIKGLIEIGYYSLQTAFYDKRI